VVLGYLALFVLGVGAQLSDDMSREQLKPLTAFRQQHRRWSAVCRSICAGHLDKHVYTGCTTVLGLVPVESSEPKWVKWQVVEGGVDSWGYCGATDCGVLQPAESKMLVVLPVVDYDAKRSLAAANVAAEVQTVRSLVSKFGKAQRAAEET
ncbi:unnamed protein product, partial [Symbiodinium sp. CCMP2456]